MHIYPWGPFCYLKQCKHADPFSKRRVGALRRAERLFKRRQRLELMPCRDYDDGYFPLSP